MGSPTLPFWDDVIWYNPNLPARYGIVLIETCYFAMDNSGVSGAEADDLSTIEDDTRDMSPSPNRASSRDGAELAEDLLRRCHELLDELQVFQEYLAKQKQAHAVEVKPFRNSIIAELKSLERVSRLVDYELQTVRRNARHQWGSLRFSPPTLADKSYSFVQQIQSPTKQYTPFNHLICHSSQLFGMLQKPPLA